MQPEEVPRATLKDLVEQRDAKAVKEEALHLEEELNEITSHQRDYLQQRDGLLPFSNFHVSLDTVGRSENVHVIFSKLEPESFENLSKVDVSDLIHIEKISGDEIIFFYILL